MLCKLQSEGKGHLSLLSHLLQKPGCTQTRIEIVHSESGPVFQNVAGWGRGAMAHFFWPPSPFLLKASPCGLLMAVASPELAEHRISGQPPSKQIRIYILTRSFSVGSTGGCPRSFIHVTQKQILIDLKVTITSLCQGLVLG